MWPTARDFHIEVANSLLGPQQLPTKCRPPCLGWRQMTGKIAQWLPLTLMPVLKDGPDRVLAGIRGQAQGEVRIRVVQSDCQRHQILSVLKVLV